MKIQNLALRITNLIPFMVLVLGCTRPLESLSTPYPEMTLSPTGSFTSESSFTPTTVSSIISTLPTNEARLLLLKNLSDNGNCKLPCLWGISPGESSFQEAQVILMPLSILSETVHLDPPGPGTIVPRYIEDDLEIYTRVTFITNPDTDIVNRIAFKAEAHKPIIKGGYEDVFDSQSFGEKSSAYMLSHILLEQGVPSSVMLATFSKELTRSGLGGFDILLLYPDQGILAHYSTQMYLVGENISGCPLNAYVEMELFPPGNSNGFLTLLQQTDWAIKLNYYKPLEEATSMSVKEFHQVFSQSTNICIETPAKLWPTPEP